MISPIVPILDILSATKEGGMATKIKPVEPDTPIYYEDDDDITGIENIPQWQIDEVNKAIAQVERGEYIPFEEVEAWLDSLGTANELPKPLPMAKR